jgi:hypothetical protein
MWRSKAASPSGLVRGSARLSAEQISTNFIFLFSISFEIKKYATSICFVLREVHPLTAKAFAPCESIYKLEGCISLNPNSFKNLQSHNNSLAASLAAINSASTDDLATEV